MSSGQADEAYVPHGQVRSDRPSQTLSKLSRTPLYAWHVANQARMVPFSGWEMPQQYRSIKEEQLAVRGGVGLFDISHMGRLIVRGEGVYEYLQSMTTNDLNRINKGKAQYTLLCDLEGGIIDDLLVYKGDPWRVVVNAATRDKDLKWLRSRLLPGIEISDVTIDTALIAVQGPSSAELLNTLGVEVRELASFGFSEFIYPSRVGEVVMVVSRTGYTGEDGFEIWLDADKATEVWQLLVEAGAVPCGLACRDICRLEAGLRLYGVDMDEQTNPYEVGLGWTVKLNKETEFCGRSSLLNVDHKPPYRLFGIQGIDKFIPRSGSQLRQGNEIVGKVTSGTFSFILNKGIGMAMLDQRVVKEGTELTSEINGRQGSCKVVELPHVRKSPLSPPQPLPTRGREA